MQVIYRLFRGIDVEREVHKMKKLLLGTSALAAVGLLAMPMPKAMAAASAGTQPIQIKVGGGFIGFLQGVSQKGGLYPGANKMNRQLYDRSWVDFHGIGKFDNGISAGVDLQIRTNNASPLQYTGNLQSADTIGGGFAFLNLAQYGRVEIGATPGAARKMWYGANTPFRTTAHGWNSPATGQLGGANSLGQPTTLIDMGDVDRAEKITYFTPRVAGFQLGVSYAPENCMMNNEPFTGADQNNGGTAGGAPVGQAGSCLFFGQMPASNIAAQQNDIVEAGLNYVGKFNGVDVGAYLGLGHASVAAQAYGNSSMRGLEEYGGGTNIGYQGFQLGASFRYSNEGNKFGGAAGTGAVGVGAGTGIQSEVAGIAPTNRWDANVGLTYHTGPWAVGASYAYAQSSQKCGEAVTGYCTASGQTAGKDKFNGVVFSGNYAIGPGVNLNAGIEHGKWDSFDNGPGAENSVWIYSVGTALFF